MRMAIKHFLNEAIYEIGKEMNRQDNRATQYPLYVVRESKEVVTHEDFSDYNIYVNEEGQKIDEDSVCEDCKMEDELREPCEDCGFKRQLPVKEEQIFNLKAGVFFTEKACEAHIAANKYHYSHPVCYTIGAWRNEEMQNIMYFLSSVAGEVPSFYK